MKVSVPKQAPVEVGKGGPSQAGWHAIADFLQCPKLYQFRHVRGLRVPLAQMFNPFAVGILVHGGRAAWFSKQCATDQKTIDFVHKKVQEEVREAKLPMSLDAERQSLTLIDAYINHWSKRPKPKVLAVEYELGPAPLKKGDPFFLFRTAKLDDVSQYLESGHQTCIGELKTDARSVKAVIEEYTLHGQTMMQQWLWQMSSQGEAKLGPVPFTMMDIIIKPQGKREATFAREPIPFNEHQFTWYVETMRGYLRAAAATDWNAVVPRNVQSCTRVYGDTHREFRVACEYRDLCKNGKVSITKYVDRNGDLLTKWRPSEGEESPPWL